MRSCKKTIASLKKKYTLDERKKEDG